MTATLPPGPRSAVLATLAWIARPVEFLERCAARYGEAFTARFVGLGRVVFLGGAEGIRTVFTADGGTLHAGEVQKFLRPLLGEHSLLVADGEVHREKRRMLGPHFRSEHAASWRRAIAEAVDLELAGWRAGAIVDLQPLMERISLGVLERLVFAPRGAERRARFRRALAAVIGLANARLVFVEALHRRRGRWSLASRVLRRAGELDRLIGEEIAERRAGGGEPPADLLAFLLAVRDRAGRPLAEEVIRDELKTFLVAAHVTTPTAMVWSLYWSLRTPGVADRLRRELDAEADADRRRGGADLPYHRAVCLETLRICPSIPVVFRKVKRPLELLDWTLAPGVLVAPCVYLAHRRPERFPDPSSFRPERFLDERFASFEYLPFGGGGHRCPGADLASWEMSVVLASLIGRRRIALADPRPVRAVHGRSGVTLVPSRPVRVRVAAP